MYRAAARAPARIFIRAPPPRQERVGSPDASRRSLASLVILDHIERARRLGLPHVYLGYWVEGSKKMGYKASYLPQERLGLHGWARVER